MGPRSSLSILVPAFFHPPTPHKQQPPAHARSDSAASVDTLASLHAPSVVIKDPSPPPDYLLGEDPFALLGTVELAPPTPTTVRGRVRSPSITSTTSPEWPSSPKAASPTTPLFHSPLVPLSLPTSVDAPALSRTRVRPATTRLAFRTRPSLPSLRELSRTHVELPVVC
jgi:hypothetical protein